MVGSKPPWFYSPSGEIVYVSNGAELVSALDLAAPQTIILRDGVYDHTSYFNNRYNHDIFADTYSAPVLNAGLAIGRTADPEWGAQIEGLTFSVSDPLKTLNGSAVHIWGNAEGASLIDITIDGLNALTNGVEVRQPKGLWVENYTGANFTDHGIIIEKNDPDVVLTDPVILKNIDVSNVSRAIPGEANGTAEFGIRVGEKAIGTNLKMRNCYWSGMWTGSAVNDSRFTGIDIDGTPDKVGLYLEHKTRNTIFEKIRIGPSVRVGINCEWASPGGGNQSAADNVVFQDGIIESTCGGVYMDELTYNTTVRRMKFIGQAAFAIGDYRGRGNLYDTEGNDYSEIAAGAHAIYQGYGGDYMTTVCGI